MRKEVPVLANIYPAGEKTCDVCGTTNLAGESFYTDFTLFSDNKSLCPDCYKVKKDIEKEKKRQRYASGEEEPSFTSEIVCPWCGHEQLDSWEMEDSDDECECNECGKAFAYERDVEVTYSSYRVESESNE